MVSRSSILFWCDPKIFDINCRTFTTLPNPSSNRVSSLGLCWFVNTSTHYSTNIGMIGNHYFHRCPGTCLTNCISFHIFKVKMFHSERLSCTLLNYNAVPSRRSWDVLLFPVIHFFSLSFVSKSRFLTHKTVLS